MLKPGVIVSGSAYVGWPGIAYGLSHETLLREGGTKNRMMLCSLLEKKTTEKLLSLLHSGV